MASATLLARVDQVGAEEVWLRYVAMAAALRRARV